MEGDCGCITGPLGKFFVLLLNKIVNKNPINLNTQNLPKTQAPPPLDFGVVWICGLKHELGSVTCHLHFKWHQKLHFCKFESNKKENRLCWKIALKNVAYYEFLSIKENEQNIVK